MSLSIRQITTAAARNRFIAFPWRIYRHDPNWVPPLRSERRAFLDPRTNPFFEHAEVGLFMAVDDRRGPQGSIAATISHHHLATHNDGAGFFGLFECVNDLAVATRLFDTAGQFLRDRGMKIMRGPMNLCINDEFGLLVNGFGNPPVVLTAYNPPYYQRLVEGYGFTKAIDWYCYYREDTPGMIPERLVRGAQRARSRHSFDIRSISRRTLSDDMEKVRQIYSKAWKKNWGAVAMTPQEIHHMAAGLVQFADMDLCLIAEVDGNPAGVSIALPDINAALVHVRDGRLFPFGFIKLLWHRRRIDMLRLLIMGVAPEYRGMGIDTYFYYETWKRGLEKGYYRSEMSQILENNGPMNNALINMGAKIYKTHRIYDYAL